MIAVRFLKTFKESIHRFNKELKLSFDLGMNPDHLLFVRLLGLNDCAADHNQISDGSGILLDLRVDLRGLSLHSLAHPLHSLAHPGDLFGVLRYLSRILADDIFNFYPAIFRCHI